MERLVNQRDLQRIRNENYKLVDNMKSLSGESSHPVMRYSTANTFAHESKKLEICMELWGQGHHLLTECRFKHGGRADIMDLDSGTAIEIVCSEKEKSLIKKSVKYPVPILVVMANGKSNR